MPDVTITIGGRDFEVACQEGEEHFLNAAARMLDTEAAALGAQVGRLPESRMLLMAGLMLADRTAGLEDQVRAVEDRMARMAAELETLRAAPQPAAAPPAAPPGPRLVVAPRAVAALEAAAARIEAIAGQAEDRQAS